MWPDFSEMKFKYCLNYPVTLKGEARYASNNAAAKCVVEACLMAYLMMQKLCTTDIKYPVHSHNGYCYVLVTRDGIWINNWIYWTFITCNYNNVSLIYTLVTHRQYSSHEVFCFLFCH
jgi:hypothetical protein